jgi:hypothetical protein
MFVLYLDEFGHSGVYDPKHPRYRHHPLFGFAGFVVEGHRWRDLDRGYLRLKATFYSHEIVRAQTLSGLRAERWEPKQMDSRRDKRFAVAVLGLIKQCGGMAFAYGSRKHSTLANHKHDALYNTHVQGMLQAFQKYLKNAAGTERGMGLVIMDRRTEALNQLVLGSAQSYLFSNPVLRLPKARLVETPLLVPSEWYHGVQAADTVGRVVGTLYRSRLLSDPAYRWTEAIFGAPLDAITKRIDAWTSVYLRA